MPSSPVKSNGAKKRRLYYLDFLKTVGLFCIIIAHVNPPNCIIAVRSFDVPLMVIISSFLAVSISAILIVILVNKFLDKLEKRKHIKLFDYLRG